WRASPIADRWLRLREQTDRQLAGPNAWRASDALFEEDFAILLSQFRRPTLCTFGSKDYVAGYQQEAASLVSRATIKPLPGEILIVDDKPELVITTIRDFIFSTLGQ